MANPNEAKYKVYDQNKIRIEVPFEIGTIISFHDIVKQEGISCPYCLGEGYIHSEAANDTTTVVCPKCNGKSVIKGIFVEEKVGRVENYVINVSNVSSSPLKVLVQEGTYNNNTFTPNAEIAPKWITWTLYSNTNINQGYKLLNGNPVSLGTCNIQILDEVAPAAVTE